MPGLLRAGVRLRPRLAEDEGGQGRRRMGRHRAEGLDDLRPVREVVHARRPHRPRRPQAQGPDLLPDGHGAGRSRSQTAGPDHRRGRVQRGLHRGSADPRRQRRRRRRQRLDGRDHDADERARRPRLRRDRPDRQQPQTRLEPRERNPPQRRHRGRRPGGPRPARAASHRGRDDAAERLPGPDQDDAVGDPRPRGLARQVAVGGHQPADRRARARHRGPLRTALPGRRARRRQWRLAVLASSAAAPTRSRAAPPTSSRTSSPSASSACRGFADMYFDLTRRAAGDQIDGARTSSPPATNPSGSGSWRRARTASSSPTGRRWPTSAGPAWRCPRSGAARASGSSSSRSSSRRWATRLPPRRCSRPPTPAWRWRPMRPTSRRSTGCGRWRPARSAAFSRSGTPARPRRRGPSAWTRGPTATTSSSTARRSSSPTPGLPISCWSPPTTGTATSSTAPPTGSRSPPSRRST